MTRPQAAHYATVTSNTHTTDAYGQTHYYVTSPLVPVRGTVAEPLHDYVVRVVFGGRHGIATRLTNVLWTKLYEFLRELDFKPYAQQHDNEHRFFRKLSLARLCYPDNATRVQRSADIDAAERGPTADE